jgi:hypothetical protein
MNWYEFTPMWAVHVRLNPKVNKTYSLTRITFVCCAYWRVVDLRHVAGFIRFYMVSIG